MEIRGCETPWVSPKKNGSRKNNDIWLIFEQKRAIARWKHLFPKQFPAIVMLRFFTMGCLVCDNDIGRTQNSGSPVGIVENFSKGGMCRLYNAAYESSTNWSCFRAKVRYCYVLSTLTLGYTNSIIEGSSMHSFQKHVNHERDSHINMGLYYLGHVNPVWI